MNFPNIADDLCTNLPRPVPDTRSAEMPGTLGVTSALVTPLEYSI